MSQSIHTSVIVPSFNRPESLSACLAAVLAQKDDELFEVVVVDDGSRVPPRVSRGLKQVRRSGRSTGLMPQVAFVMFAAACTGAAGEMLGYLFGTKESHVRERTDVELDRYSYVRNADRKTVRKGDPDF